MTAARDWVPHPGEFIKEELDERGWNQRDLAFILGCPEQAVTMILTGKRGISPDMARALGNVFDVSAEFFSKLRAPTITKLARAVKNQFRQKPSNFAYNLFFL